VTTSVPAESTASTILHRDSDSLPARVMGVLRSPRGTFEAVSAEPRWKGILALTFVVSAVSSALLLGTEVGQLALLDQWERTAIAFGQPIDDAQYAAMLDASRDGGIAYAVASSLASGPVLALALAALLFVLFRRSSPGVSYQQVLAVVAHAGVILAVRQVIAAPVNYARETLASPTTASLFVTMLDEASPVARFFGVIDLFVLWWIGALAVGMSVLYRRPARPLAIRFVGAYITLALILAIVMAVTGGTA
jgi:hypothetical protein